MKTLKRHLSWILGLALVMLLVACGGNISNDKFSTGKGAVQGQLFLPGGEPAAGATVYVVGAVNLKAETDAQGRFLLQQVPAGKQKLFVTHTRPLGLLAPVWVVHNNKISLKEDQKTLKPTATLTGTVNAQARFGGKGIVVSIVGTPFQTKTFNHEGEFRFDRVVQGCHTFRFSASYFTTVEKSLCVDDARETVSLNTPIRLVPRRTCASQGGACEGQGNVCREGFCVPEAGGEVRLTQREIGLPDVPLGEARTVEVAPLSNVGAGVLLIKRATLKGPSGDFTIQQKTFPIRIPRGESLRLPLLFQTTSQEEQRAVLEIETSDPESPTVQVVIKAKAQAFKERCLKIRRTRGTNRGTPAGQERPLSFALLNRCERPIAVQRVELGFPSLLQARADLKLPLTLEATESKEFDLFVSSKAFGRLEGTLTFHYEGSSEKSVKVLVEDTRALEGLTLSHGVLGFGAVPMAHTRALKLQLRLTRGDVDPTQFQTSLFKGSAPGFQSGKAVEQRRGADDNRILYFPVSFTPGSAGLQQGWWVLRHPTLLGERFFMVRLRGTVSTSASLLSSASVEMGRVAFCKPKFNAGLYVANPGRAPLVIRSVKLESLTPEDFQIGFKTLPLVVPPRTSLELKRGVQLGEGFFRATRSELQAYASLRLTVEQGGVRLPDVVIPLSGSSGKPYRETFLQAKPTNARLLVYMSARVLDNHVRRSQLIGMLAEIVTEMKKHQIALEVRALKRDENSPRPVLSTTYQKGDVTRFLSSLKRTADENPVGLQWMHRYLLEQKKTITLPTAVMFVSYYDDKSPLPLSYYHPKLRQDAPFQIFSGVPSSNCRSIKEATRLYRAPAFYGGYRFNFCSPTTLGLRSWGKNIVSFFRGKQRSFLLKASYQKSELAGLKVSVNGKDLPRSAGSHPNWTHRYVPAAGGEPGYHRIEFHSKGHHRESAPGPKVEVSYYDVCLPE